MFFFLLCLAVLLSVCLQAQQEVPKWLEIAAESAVGSGYGPSGGRFGGKDIREVSLQSESLVVN